MIFLDVQWPYLILSNMFFYKKACFIKFIKSGDDFDSYFTFKPTLMEIPYVIETLKSINLKYYGKEILTDRRPEQR